MIQTLRRFSTRIGQIRFKRHFGTDIIIEQRRINHLTDFEMEQEQNKAQRKLEDFKHWKMPEIKENSYRSGLKIKNSLWPIDLVRFLAVFADFFVRLSLFLMMEKS